MIQINNIKIDIKKDNYDNLLKKAVNILNIKKGLIKELKIKRKSLDAREKPNLFYVYNIAVSLPPKKEEMILDKNKNRNISAYKEVELFIPKIKIDKGKYNRPIIVGAGPSGLFAAYYLSLAGLCPLVLERGKDVDERKKDIDKFWETNILNKESNVSFGEGGAGTFSDGKLTTQVNDKSGRIDFILKTFVECGAKESILYESKPHLGTDELIHIIKNLRNKIINLGGEVRFNSKVSNFVIENNLLKEIIVNDTKRIKTNNLILSVGHSARDTIRKLYELGIPMESKSFAVGFRVEHPQSFINKSQYGNNKLNLPAAAYKLAYNKKGERSVYSFCMCPGGYVVNASSEDNSMVVNGMSYSKRDSKNANSAIIVAVGEKDFGDSNPMSAIKYQECIEKKAYELGKGKIPQQLYSDFVNNVTSTTYGAFSSVVKGEAVFSNLRSIFSDDINSSFILGMNYFDNKIKGFSMPDSILSGIESRTSSPVRIIRNNEFESEIKGLYPTGEGAGFAGGITSAAIDGLKVAEQIAKNINNFVVGANFGY